MVGEGGRVGSVGGLEDVRSPPTTFRSLCFVFLGFFFSFRSCLCFLLTSSCVLVILFMSSFVGLLCRGYVI